MKGMGTVGGLAALTVAWALGSGAALAQDAGAAALRQADAGTFAAADLNGDGEISRREVIHFTDLVFLSIDADGDDTLTVEEFLIWDTGYAHAAEAMSKLDAFNEAKEDVFGQLDLNGDGVVEHPEMSAAMLYFFYTADVDQSRYLDQEEFTQEFQVLNTLRGSLE